MVFLDLFSVRLVFWKSCAQNAVADKEGAVPTAANRQHAIGSFSFTFSFFVVICLSWQQDSVLLSLSAKLFKSLFFPSALFNCSKLTLENLTAFPSSFIYFPPIWCNLLCALLDSVKLILVFFWNFPIKVAPNVSPVIKFAFLKNI